MLEIDNLINSLIKGLKFRFRISSPFFVYEITSDELVNSNNVDERIAKLGKVHSDLLDAVNAVEVLQNEANQSKSDVAKLENEIKHLKQDKETTEKLLQVPQDSFARVLDKATSKAQWRGLLYGFILGIAASLIATAAWTYGENLTNTHNE